MSRYGYSSSESSSDEDSDRDNPYLNDDATPAPLYEEFPDSDTGFWYEAFSARGGAFCGNLKSSTRLKVKLKYNTCDDLLLNKSRMEAKQALHKVRHKLRSLKTLRQVGPEEKLKLDAFDAFAGALPLQFLLLFKKWLCTGTDRNAVNVSLDDLVGWLRCELIMRIFNGSSQDLEWWGAAETDRNRYKRVRLAMTKADRPVSKREVLYGTARAMPGTFDPINIELEQACCKEWIDMFFVNGSSWVDIDDDKLNHSSKNFPKYGYRVTPTKDKKFKPVIHVMAFEMASKPPS